MRFLIALLLSSQHVCHERRDESPEFHEEPKNETVSEQQKAWERGEIDFAKKDRFDVIQHYIDNVIEGVPNVEVRSYLLFPHFLACLLVFILATIKEL